MRSFWENRKDADEYKVWTDLNLKVTYDPYIWNSKIPNLPIFLGALLVF